MTRSFHAKRFLNVKEPDAQIVTTRKKGNKMPHLCEDHKKEKHDAQKAAERKAEGKRYFVCEKCKRTSHKEDHLCQPKKA